MATWVVCDPLYIMVIAQSIVDGRRGRAFVPVCHHSVIYTSSHNLYIYIHVRIHIIKNIGHWICAVIPVLVFVQEHLLNQKSEQVGNLATLLRSLVQNSSSSNCLLCMCKLLAAHPEWICLCDTKGVKFVY